MDELSTWYEVLRSLLPQRYDMRLLWGRRAIVVTSPVTGEVVWLDEQELPGRSPSAVVALVRRRLREGEIRSIHAAAC
jgi:hypothetical protein